MNNKATAVTYPCEVFIKAIGKHSPDLKNIVFFIAKQYAPDLEENAVQIKASENGNYLSVTVRMMAESKEQQDKIYLALSECQQILMTL